MKPAGRPTTRPPFSTIRPSVSEDGVSHEPIRRSGRGIREGDPGAGPIRFCGSGRQKWNAAQPAVDYFAANMTRVATGIRSVNTPALPKKEDMGQSLNAPSPAIC